MYMCRTTCSIATPQPSSVPLSLCPSLHPPLANTSYFILVAFFIHVLKSLCIDNIEPTSLWGGCSTVLGITVFCAVGGKQGNVYPTCEKLLYMVRAVNAIHFCMLFYIFLIMIIIILLLLYYAIVSVLTPTDCVGCSQCRRYRQLLVFINSCLFSLPNNETLVILLLWTVHVSAGLAMLTAALQLSFASTPVSALTAKDTRTRSLNR